MTYDATHIAITWEQAWQEFTPPAPGKPSGKVSKSAPVNRMPPEGAALAVITGITPGCRDLCWWNGKEWQYVTTRISRDDFTRNCKP